MNMKIRAIAIGVLVAFMTAGIAAAVLREKNAATKRPGGAAPAAPAADGKGPIVVYYFHGYQRCTGCRRTEKMLRDAMQEAFGEEIKAGEVAFRAINVEDLANVDIVERFSVTARHPVVADETNGPGGPWQEISPLPGDPVQVRQTLEAIVRPMLARRKGNAP